MSKRTTTFAVLRSEKEKEILRDFADFFCTLLLKNRQLPPASGSESTDKSNPFQTVTAGQATAF